MASNPFIGLTSAQLATLQTAYVSAVTAIASGQSYALNGRQLTRANLSDVTATLGQINAAIADASQASTTQTFVSFTGL